MGMATVQQFEDLGVWQDARQLTKAIYQVTKLKLSKRLARFISCLETYPSNSRVRRAPNP
jgi:hypothetical protein